MNLDRVRYGKWNDCIKLTNGKAELIVTTMVGPRIIRLGFKGGSNVFGEMRDQLGGAGEKQWMIRGGHRLWIAPEGMPRSYEPDNSPVEARKIRNGVKVVQPPGPITRIAKAMEISVLPDKNAFRVVHVLRNKGDAPFRLSAWALTVMARRGTAVIPLPQKTSHSDSLSFNQEWSLWGYTDLSDPRWKIGSGYIRFRQDPKRGPNKLGLTNRNGWVAYQLRGNLFIKRFKRNDAKPYPDGNVNFETYSDKDILELESLGPLVMLKPGGSVRHEEIWSLHEGIKTCRTEQEIEQRIAPLVAR